MVGKVSAPSSGDGEDEERNTAQLASTKKKKDTVEESGELKKVVKNRAMEKQ